MIHLTSEVKLNKVRDTDSCVVVELDLNEWVSKRQKRIMRDASKTVEIKLVSEERLNALAKIATEYQPDLKIEQHSNGKIFSKILKIIAD